MLAINVICLFQSYVELQHFFKCYKKPLVRLVSLESLNIDSKGVVSFHW